MIDNSLCTAPGWSVIDITEDGEAVICYGESDIFIMAKVRTMPDTVPLDSVVSSYVTRLENEVVVESESSTCLVLNNVLWSLYNYTIKSDMVKFVLHACAVIDGYNCVIEANLLTIEDYSELVKQFSVLCSSVDFKQLRRAVGEVKAGNATVKVTGLSGIRMRESGNPNSLVFLGKDKYFSVTVRNESQRDKLVSAMREYNYEVLNQGCGEHSKSGRYQLYKEEQPSAIVELDTIEV